jgi:uncharacterized protein
MENSMNHEKSFRLFSHIFALVLVAAIVSTTSGCSLLQKHPLSSTISTEMLSTNDLAKVADQAWVEKDYMASELYYTRLLARADVPQRTILPAIERLSVSSYKSGHYHEAQARLEEWRKLSPEALNSEVWQNCYFESLAAIKSFAKLRTHLAKTMENSALPWNIRSQAGINLSSLDQNEESLAALERLYSIAPNDEDKKDLERWFSAAMVSKSDQELQNDSKLISAGNNLKFPYELVLFELATRQSSTEEYWPMAWRTMSSVVHKGQLIDKPWFNKIISNLEAKYGIPRVGIALVLPISGRFQDYGWKIIRGAGAAQWELTKAGLDVDVQVINTEEPGWTKRVQDLPPWYTVLGGPINVKAFKELEQSEVYKEKVSFSFLAKPGNLEEGKQAWRFFASPEDQIRSSLNLAINDLGIHNFAILYPQEKFGRQMSKIFLDMATARGAKVTGMESYPPNNFPKWSKIVGKLVKAPQKEASNAANGLGEDAPLAETDLDAVFIPDTWNQAKLLIPHFFFHEADTLVFLGPELWSQALNSARGTETQNLQLTVAPGAWWSGSKGAIDLKEVMDHEGLGTPDFWVALGYDFIKFSSRLGTFSSDWTPNEVNERIATAQQMEFSLAPITWDSNGKANQKLFLFRPERNGKTKIDAYDIKSTLNSAKNRRARRIKAWKKTRSNNN